MITRLVVISIGLLMSAAVFSAAPVSHFTVKVLDENGAPIEGVVVEGGFSNLKRDYVPGPGVRAITDAKGEADIFGPAYFYVDIIANKEEFYKSKKSVSINIEKDQDISILLRKKRNPIAMYAKHFKGYIPKNKTKIAFDFIRGDWVQPYGKGSTEDVYFFYDGYSYNFFDYGGELKISFPNESDGLIDMEYENGHYSELKLPYSAPENGYKMEKILVHKRKGKGASTIKKNNLNKKVNYGYFFRVRSELDSDGNIVQANYVKIGGEIVFDPRSEGRGAAYLEMTYYFNPSVDDRNMEFDQKRNLFKSLKPEERVVAP